MVINESHILALVHPELVSEWAEENGDLTPYDVTYASKKVVWWKCKKGHKWQAVIAHRHQGNGCPICANKVVLQGYNDLATTFPNLAAEWSERNADLKPTEVVAGSHRKVWWRCKEGHEWKAQINDRSRDGNGCPYCKRRKALRGFNDMASLHPELAREWSVKNLPYTPDMFMSSSHKKVWWKCEKGHEWQAEVVNRACEGQGCPYCSYRRLEAGVNDFMTLYPELAKEWSERNEDIYPFQISPYSRKCVWWKCPDCDQEWWGMIYRRTNKGMSCPHCRKVKGKIATAERRAEKRALEKIEKTLPEYLIQKYCEEKNITYECNTMYTSGIMIQYLFPEQKGVLEFANHWKRTSAGWKRQYLKNDMLKKAGYKVVMILERGDKEYDNCICIRRDGDTGEELAAILRAAFVLMGVG